VWAVRAPERDVRVALPLHLLDGHAFLPAVTSGGLKIVYDVLIWLSFRKVKLR
jgi:hypothetical protein